MKKRNTAGTHNGMKSIIYQIQDDNFPRIKLAVGKKPSYMDLANFVLSGFTEKEAEIIRQEISLASCAIETIIGDSIDKAMNNSNSIRLVDESNEWFTW